MRSSPAVWLVLAASFYPSVAAAIGSAQATEVVVSPTEAIKAGYKTYSLFLICNPGWLQPDSGKPQTQWLYQSFQRFGRAIGDDNLAVWFWRSRKKENRFLADPDNVDLQRSARFCKAWHLTPSAGPHLVITSTYPDERKLASGMPDQSAVFELGNMADNQINDLLTKLTDQLLLSGKIEKGAVTPPQSQNQPLNSSPLWVRLLGAVQQTINNFGCAWSFKIDAGAVKADLHSCTNKSA